MKPQRFRKRKGSASLNYMCPFSLIFMNGDTISIRRCKELFEIWKRLSDQRNEHHVSRALSLQTTIAQATAHIELASFKDCCTSNARSLELLLREQRPAMHYLLSLTFKKTSRAAILRNDRLRGLKNEAERKRSAWTKWSRSYGGVLGCLSNRFCDQISSRTLLRLLYFL